MMQLDLGCGKNKEAGSIGVDIACDSAADVICDLNHPILPFKDKTFDRVLSRQVFEHLNDVEAVMAEIRRILKRGGRLKIFVPHFTCFYSYADPSHRRTFSFFAFDKLATRCGFRIVARKITFRRFLRISGVSFFANHHPRSYERYWAFMLPAEFLMYEFEAVERAPHSKGKLKV